MRSPSAWLAHLIVLSLIVHGVAAAEPTKKKKRGADGRADLTSEMPPDARPLAIGEAAPDFNLKGVDGRTYRLADFRQHKLLLVVFLSNNCPYSHAAETRLIPLAKEFRDRGVGVVAINPNCPEAVALAELGYGKYNDSFAESVLYAKEQGFPFPYLYDGDTQTTAKAFGCLATPHAFLFDEQRRLRYAGRIDDSRFEDLASVTKHDVGCATKWKSKAAAVAASEAQVSATPVELARADAAQIAQLLSQPSKRLRVVNVWATWCAPCVAEFPSLVSLSRRFANRDFEFITVSMDRPNQEPAVRRFLEQNGAAPSNRLRRQISAEGRATTHYLYTGASTEDLVKAVDPEWAGPLPHTVVISPAGQILYRHNGPIDPAKLLDVVLGALGTYYQP
jgi:peroxiredoxin